MSTGWGAAATSPSSDKATTVDLLIAVLWAASIVTMTAVAAGFGPEARRAPLLVGSVGTVLAVSLLVRTALHRYREGSATHADRAAAGGLSATLWTTGFVVCFVLLGHLGPVLVATPLFLSIRCREPVRVIAVMVLCMLAGGYVLLHLVLGAALHTGWLGDWLVATRPPA